MTTGYQEFPITEPFKTSHPMLLSNDKAALTMNAGTAFPAAANTFEGMYCWRTDEKKLYRYSGGAWAVADIQGNAASATKLQTARTIAVGTAVTSNATAFNGTANITIPITTVKEGFLTWGGQNHVSYFGPLDAALVSQLGANRLCFLKPGGVTVEYSRDGGATWVDYGASDIQKQGLFSTSVDLYIGGHTTDITVNDQLRITIENPKAGVYTRLEKFVILYSTNGASGSWCTLETATAAAPTTFVTRVNKQSVEGWSGYNIINSSIETFGGGFTSQNKYVRFTFGCTGLSTQYSNAACVLSIYGYGGVGWTTPSTMAKTGHLYSYDYAQNATFPATVTASKFSGSFSMTVGTDNAARIIPFQDSALVSSTDSFKACYDTSFTFNPATDTLTVTNANIGTLTGTPKAPTAAAGTNTTQVATTAFVTTAVSNATTSINTALRNLISTWGGTLP